MSATAAEYNAQVIDEFRGKLPDDQIWEIAAYVHSFVNGAPEPAGE